MEKSDEQKNSYYTKHPKNKAETFLDTFGVINELKKTNKKTNPEVLDQAFDQSC